MRMRPSFPKRINSSHPLNEPIQKKANFFKGLPCIASMKNRRPSRILTKLSKLSILTAEKRGERCVKRGQIREII